MANEEAKQRVKKLRELINHHRYLYHVLDKEEISSQALDSLKKELFNLEKLYPDLITEDSPTQRVGGVPLKEFKKVAHRERMLSLNDCFSQEDVRDWQERISKLLIREEIKDLNYYCELKLDGLAIELIYKGGLLKVGATRGDGVIGEDVTQNLKVIEAIPLKLRDQNNVIKELESVGLKNIVDTIKSKGLGEIIVRGEVFLNKKEFNAINKQQVKNGLPVFANPRNIAAGSIRQLDSKVTSSRKLDSNAYDLLTDFGQATHEEKHQILKALGFKINKNNKYCKDFKEVFEFHKNWQNHREKLPYEIDGIVVIINNNNIFNKLGVVGKTPRGAVAYKFPLKQATTKVRDIVVQVGRTGAITPVAHLQPVNISGVIITRATLHNKDEIERLGLKTGDTVIVGRAGDVIPDIVKVLSELRTGKEKDFKMPKICPSCGAKLEKSETEALLRCPNPKCFARQKKLFHYFVSRSAFDIRGVGPKIINKLLDFGLISDPADLFDLEVGDIVVLNGSPRSKPKALLPGFAEKSAENLISSIKKKKDISLLRFIYALGIRNVGTETARDLTEMFSAQGGPASGWEDMGKLEKASLEDLQNIQNIGPVVAKSIVEWFAERRNIKFLQKLKKVGIKIHHQESVASQKLKGRIFVFTGELETLSREKAKDIVRGLGADVSESVSKNTSFVVVGENPGSKLKEAEKVGVKIINEEEFLKMVHPVK